MGGIDTASNGSSDAGVHATQAGLGLRVWVENTPYGDAEVMVLNPAVGARPFCYCSFHYRAGYTDAGTVHRAAERMAIDLGAEVPVRFVARFEC
jgi:hypothetical protein